MLQSIMRSLGYVPTTEYETLVTRVSVLQDENAKLRDNARKVLSESDQIAERARVSELRASGLADERKSLEDEIIRLRRESSILNKTIVALTDEANSPQFTVRDAGKTLTLQAKHRKDVLDIKSSVRNNKNLDHFNMLARTLNGMEHARIENYQRLVREAQAEPARQHDYSPPPPQVLDKPLGVPAPLDKPQGR